MLLVMTGLIVKNTDREDVYEIVKYKILDLESCEEFEMSLEEIDSNDISVMGIYDAEFNAMHNGEKVYHRGGSENYDALYYTMGGRTYKGGKHRVYNESGEVILGEDIKLLRIKYEKDGKDIEYDLDLVVDIDTHKQEIFYWGYSTSFKSFWEEFEDIEHFKVVKVAVVKELDLYNLEKYLIKNFDLEIGNSKYYSYRGVYRLSLDSSGGGCFIVGSDVNVVGITTANNEPSKLKTQVVLKPNINALVIDGELQGDEDVFNNRQLFGYNKDKVNAEYIVSLVQLLSIASSLELYISKNTDVEVIKDLAFVFCDRMSKGHISLEKLLRPFNFEFSSDEFGHNLVNLRKMLNKNEYTLGSLVESLNKLGFCIKTY
jgi:hypothetical protein